MKAMVYTEYGPPEVLQLKEVEKPTPKEDEVLVKVHAASANARDWHLMRADPFLVRLMTGLLKPKNKMKHTVTPLKDRIDSQIITHYPKSIAIGKKITEQESNLTETQKESILVIDKSTIMIADEKQRLVGGGNLYKMKI